MVRMAIKDMIMTVLPQLNHEEGKKFCLQTEHGKSGSTKAVLIAGTARSEEISSAIGEIFGVEIDPRTVCSCLRTIINWQSDINGAGHNLACLGLYYPYGGLVEEPVRGYYRFRPFTDRDSVPVLHPDPVRMKNSDDMLTGYAIKDAVMYCLRDLRLNASADTYKATARQIAEVIMRMGVASGKKAGTVEKTVKRLMKTLTVLRSDENEIFCAMVKTPWGGTVECDSTDYDYAYVTRHCCEVVDTPRNGKKRVSKGNGKSVSLKPNCRYYFKAES